ncbi:MAG: S41 family peptidase, partial [Rubrivivax sp.]|nr:S41 family peptidase [Rubrivivax sp.]
MKRRRLLMLAPALVAPLGACQRAGAAAETPTPLTPQQLQQDLSQWRQAVLDRHPRFHGQPRLDDALEAAFAHVAKQANTPMDRQAAFSVLSKVNPHFADAHTLLMPWLSGQPPAGRQKDWRFPFGVKLAAGARLQLRSSWRRGSDGHQLLAASEVLSINGTATQDLLQQLLAHSHGETAALRQHMLTLMWPDWLLAVKGWQMPFSLQLRPPAAGPDTEITLRANDTWTPTRVAPELPTLQTLPDGTALLKVPTFDVDDQAAAYSQALKSAFARLRQQAHPQRNPRLVIDVRGNTGGQSDAGAELIQPFISQPAQQVSRARERLNADNKGWFGQHGAVGTVREFDLGREGLIQPLPPAERWRGRTAVLVDEMSYSATILFATTMQDLK